MPTQTGHIDVYQKYNFHVLVDGIFVAGFHRVSNIGWEIQEKDYAEGNSPIAMRRLRRFTKVKDIVLEAGMTRDTSFFHWGLNAADYHAAVGGKVKRNVHIQYLDRNGNIQKIRILMNCWVKEWQSGDFDAMANEALIERMVLAPEYLS